MPVLECTTLWTLVILRHFELERALNAATTAETVEKILRSGNRSSNSDASFNSRSGSGALATATSMPCETSFSKNGRSFSTAV